MVTRTKKQAEKQVENPAPIEVQPAKIEQFTTLQTATPQAFVSKKSFRVEAVIPTEQYAGVRPVIEIEYTVPEGAAAPESQTVLADLYQELALSVVPAINHQVDALRLNSEVVKKMAAALDSADPVASMATVIMFYSPLFRWLSVMARDLARQLVQGKVEYYKAVQQQRRAPVTPANQQPATPKTQNPRPQPPQTNQSYYDKGPEYQAPAIDPLADYGQEDTYGQPENDMDDEFENELSTQD